MIAWWALSAPCIYAVDRAAWPEGVARAALMLACCVLVCDWVRARAACWFHAVLTAVEEEGWCASALSFSKRVLSKHANFVWGPWWLET